MNSPPYEAGEIEILLHEMRNHFPLIDALLLLTILAFYGIPGGLHKMACSRPKNCKLSKSTKHKHKKPSATLHDQLLFKNNEFDEFHDIEVPASRNYFLSPCRIKELSGLDNIQCCRRQPRRLARARINHRHYMVGPVLWRCGG